MVDLQRSINTEPAVASVGNAPPPDTSIASAIQAVGSEVRTFVAQKKKTALEEELSALGDEVFAARTGKELDKVSERFTRLKQGQDQGVLTDTMVKIEAEKILKESIDSMPAFGPELRQHAAQIIGYDPTGTQIRALMNIPTGGSGRQSFAEKQLEQAQFISQNTGVAVEDVMRLQGKNLLANLRADFITQQASIGAAGRRDIFNATMQESDRYVSEFMWKLLTQIKGGGVDNIQQTLGVLDAHVLGQKQALRDRYAAAGISPDSAEMARDLKLVDEQWASLKEVAETGSLGNILQSNVTNLGNALTIDGYNVMGDVAIFNKIGGQEGVKNYFNWMNKFGKQEQLDLLAATNPALSRFLGDRDTAVKAAADSYKRVMGVEPSFQNRQFGGSAEEQAAMQALDDATFYNATKTASLSEDEKIRRLSYAQAQGQRYKVLGAYFQKGAKEAASPEEVQFVKQTFEEEYPQLVARLAGQLANFTDIEISLQGNRIVANDVQMDPTNTFALQPLGSISSFPIKMTKPASAQPVPESIRDDLKRLNSFVSGVNNGWSRELGQNPVTFVNDVMQDIHNGKSQNAERQDAVNTAIDNFRTQPTPENLEALRKVDPDLVARIERNAASQVGSSAGGSNNAN